jgi:hypothetical protein
LIVRPSATEKGMEVAVPELVSTLEDLTVFGRLLIQEGIPTLMLVAIPERGMNDCCETPLVVQTSGHD